MANVGKVLITGAKGQLGHDLMEILASDYEVVGADIEEFDLRHRSAVQEFFRLRRPDIVVHAAAYTDVDGCESNKDQAMAINGAGTKNIALACKEVGAHLLYYSTDYVFAGDKDAPYSEEDSPDPRTVYGRSKLEGERAIQDILAAHTILRIAWIYGRHGKNFVRTMLKLGADQIKKAEAGESVTPLKVVDDQFGNPTWTVEVVRQTREVLKHRLTGLYHATAHGETSWFRFAAAIFEQMKMPVDLVPCTTDEFPRPAPRPARSSLDNSGLRRAGIDVMRDWNAALSDFLSRHGKEMLP